MRPVVKPALRWIWRDATTLQLGISPACAVVLTGLGPQARTLLRSLDGSLTLADAQHVASAAGPPSVALLLALHTAGAIDDHELIRPDDPLSAERAALTLSHAQPGGAARTLAVRAAAHIVVEGTGPVAAAVASTLSAAGVGHVTTESQCQSRAARPQLVILCPPAEGETARARGVRLHAARIAHLPAYVCETTGVIGPLVLPGRSCCLHCVFLHRCDRDPQWPVVATQLLEHRPEDTVAACPSALATTVAGIAASQALELIDANADKQPNMVTDIATMGATLEVATPGWSVRRRGWTVHPECACA